MRGQPGFHGRPMRPEDLFNFFEMGPGAGFAFGGPGMRFHFAGPGGQRYYRQGQRQRGGGGQRAQEQVDPTFGIIQLLPLIIVLLFTFLNFGGNENSASSSQYTFVRDVHHPIKRQTASREVKYWVRQNWEREVSMRFGEKSQWMEEFEARVEMDYHAKLMKECNAETKSKDQSYLSAMQRSDVKEAKNAYKAPPKACEKLYEFFGEYH